MKSQDFYSISQSKKLWFPSYYARNRQIQFKTNVIPNELKNIYASSSIVS